jgi:large subunit ribosomal protein L23
MPILKRTKKTTDVAADEVAKPVETAETKKVVAKKRVAKKVAAPKAQKSSGLSAFAVSILIAPIATEKSAKLSDASMVTFKVHPSANRVSVRQAFKEAYGVMPRKVNVMNVHGKEKRFGGFASRRSDWKKAIVLLPEGTTVNVFETV